MVEDIAREREPARPIMGPIRGFVPGEAPDSARWHRLVQVDFGKPGDRQYRQMRADEGSGVGRGHARTLEREDGMGNRHCERSAALSSSRSFMMVELGRASCRERGGQEV